MLTTKSDECKALGGFWDIYGKLPDSVLGKIISYDDTYQKIMQEKVLVNIWKGRWLRFADGIECPYCKLALDYLFQQWGFDEDDYDRDSWQRETYFPNEFRFIISNNSNFVNIAGISIKIYTSTPDFANFEVFEGWVLNESEQKEAALLSNRKLDRLNIENVHWNDENLYLWRQFAR